MSRVFKHCIPCFFDLAPGTYNIPECGVYNLVESASFLLKIEAYLLLAPLISFLVFLALRVAANLESLTS